MLKVKCIATMHLITYKSEVVQVVIMMIIMSMSIIFLLANSWCECDVLPGQVVLSRHAPGKWRVSGRGQRGGAYRLAATHVWANVVVLMRGVSWTDTTGNGQFKFALFVRSLSLAQVTRANSRLCLCGHCESHVD